MQQKFYLSETASWIIFFSLCLVRIAITAPLYTQVDTRQIFDDILFAQQAIHITQGNWLGPYNSLTLCKGPIYPIFLAIVHGFGLPYLFTLSLFRCICLGYLLFCCQSYFQSRWLWLLLGLSILFDPIEISGRLLRNDLYFSLICVFLGVLVTSFFQRKKQHAVLTSIECLFVACCYGMVWFIREEAALLNFTLAITIICLFLYKFIFKKHMMYKYIISGICGVVIFYLTISLLNYHYYGRFVSIETTSYPYKTAYSKLLSINDPINKPGIMLSNAKIHQVAKFVPTMATLEPCMTSGSIFNNWRVGSPAFFEKDLTWAPDPTKPYVSGNFIEWQLRQCVDKAGYYKTSITAATFYRTMAKELDTALAAHELQKAPCRFVFGSFFVDFNDWHLFLRSLSRGIDLVFFTNRIPFTKENTVSIGDDKQITEYKTFFNLQVLATGKQKIVPEWTNMAYRTWSFITSIFNIFPKYIFSLIAILILPFFYIIFIKKDFVSLSFFIICSSFIFSRYVSLALIHIRGFYALFVSYYSAGYIAMYLASFFLLDKNISFAKEFYPQRYNLPFFRVFRG